MDRNRVEYHGQKNGETVIEVLSDLDTRYSSSDPINHPAYTETDTSRCSTSIKHWFPDFMVANKK